MSIILPIYNVEDYLAECLESVATQSFADFEAICVVDGSADGSESIAREFCERDRRFKLVLKENGGLSSARNAGIDAACGRILMFVDSDDMLKPDACKTVVEAFAAHGGAVEIVTFGAECFPDSEEYGWYHDVLSPRAVWFERFDPDLVFVERSRPFVWRTAIASSFFKRTRLRFDETVRFGEDQIFQFAAYPRAHGVALIPDKLYRYRMNRANSLMAERGADTLLKLYEHLVIADRICEDWSRAGYFARYRSEMRAWAADFLWWNMFAEPIENQAALLEPTQAFWRRWFGPDAGFAVSRSNPFESLCAFLIEGPADALSAEYAAVRDAWLKSLEPDTSPLGRARTAGGELLSRLVPGMRERLHPRN